MKIFLNSGVSMPSLCLKIAAEFGICFCASLSCPAYWAHEVHCTLERKSKYWVVLTEVIVSPCLDTTSNWCLLDLLCLPCTYKCMNCFVFYCIKCTVPQLLLSCNQSKRLCIMHWWTVLWLFSIFSNSRRQMIFTFCKSAIFLFHWCCIFLQLLCV